MEAMMDDDIRELDETILSHRQVLGTKGVPHKGGWTSERIELLKKLWEEGLSASQIAAALGGGLTRNAVIGKVHRLKLGGRAKPRSTPPHPRRPRRLPRSANSNLPGNNNGRRALNSLRRANAPVTGASPLRVEGNDDDYNGRFDEIREPFIPVGQRLSVMQLNEHTCKWPIGDPLSPDFYFCGQASNEGQPYCEFHSRRAYYPLEKRRRHAMSPSVRAEIRHADQAI